MQKKGSCCCVCVYIYPDVAVVHNWTMWVFFNSGLFTSQRTSWFQNLCVLLTMKPKREGPRPPELSLKAPDVCMYVSSRWDVHASNKKNHCCPKSQEGIIILRILHKISLTNTSKNNYADEWHITYDCDRDSDEMTAVQINMCPGPVPVPTWVSNRCMHDLHWIQLWQMPGSCKPSC
jgi:hypothetical protein